MHALNAEFDAVIKVAARTLLDEDVEYARSIDTSDTVISKKAFNRIRHKIKRFDRVSLWGMLPLSCRRIVAAVLCICTIAFCVCMSITPVRAEFAKIWMQIYEKFASVFYVSEKMPPEFIEKYKEPALQLAGTERYVEAQNPVCYSILYMAGDTIEVAYDQTVITEDAHAHDSERCSISDTNVAGCDAKLFTYEDGRIHLTWHDNEYVYTISSYSQNIDSELIFKMAESVK